MTNSTTGATELLGRPTQAHRLMIAVDHAPTKLHRRFWTAVWTVWALNLLTMTTIVAHQFVVRVS
jgi:hypothetical protein